VSKLVIVGAGGHARVLMEALCASAAEVIGFITREPEQATGVMARLVRLGSDEDLLSGGARDVLLVNGVGSTGRPEMRRAVFERFRAAGFAFSTVLHPAATVASDVELGEGAQIMAGAVLQPGSRIGANAIVNTGAVIDHDAMIGAHVHVAPRACLAGNVRVGEGTHIGAGAVVVQNRRIGANVLVAAGAVVVADVPTATIVRGVPARPAERAS
jgi:sugar O-acyltransferase (sialic acid O-acetyltransferase NeuD family)